VTARQHVVADVYRVHFLETSGYHANAQISSQINYMGGIVIMGGATTHMSASRNSFISATADISIPDPVSFGCFASAAYNSNILFGDVNVTGVFDSGARKRKALLPVPTLTRLSGDVPPFC
jgi:hypothetical protein